MLTCDVLYIRMNDEERVDGCMNDVGHRYCKTNKIDNQLYCYVFHILYLLSMELSYSHAF